MGGKELDLGIAGLELATRIGEGGNALVYRARQPALDRSVAVKVLKQADEDTRRRFDRERRAMGRLSQHDGIVTVYETGYTPGGEPFLVMPLLERALDDEIRDRGPFPWREAVGLTADVCLTVAYAHDQGVVHRDLKPGNLMRALSGRVMVSDFGISRITNTSTSLMSTALTLTPAFSPPEALEVGDALPQSDVYSLGATLYALLAGHPPFMPPEEEVPMLALMRRIMDQAIEPLPAPVPDSVNEVLRIALAKSPGDRYPSAKEMAVALTAATDVPARVDDTVKRPAAESSPRVTRSEATTTPATTEPLRQADDDAVSRPAREVPALQRASVGPKPVEPPRGSGNSSLLWIVGALLAVVAIGAVALLATRGGDEPGTAGATTEPSPGEDGVTLDSTDGESLGGSAPAATDSADPDSESGGTEPRTTEPLVNAFNVVDGSERRIDGVRVSHIIGQFAIGTTGGLLTLDESTPSLVEVVIIDRASGTEVVRLPMEDDAVFITDALAHSNGEIWISLANQRGIVVFDPSCGCIDRTMPVRTIIIHALHEVDGLVWVDDYDPSASRTVLVGLDVAGNIVREILPPDDTNTRLTNLRFGNRLVVSDNPGLIFVDVATQTVAPPIGQRAESALAASASTVFWTDFDESVLRAVEIETGTEREVLVGAPAGDGVLTISSPMIDTVSGLVWVTDVADEAAVAYDPDDLSEVHRVTLGAAPRGSPPQVAQGHVWVVAGDEVTAIDPWSGTVVARLPAPTEEFFVYASTFDVVDDQVFVGAYDFDTEQIVTMIYSVS